MPQCSGTHLLTRLVQHATLSESGLKRACSKRARDNPMSLIVTCQKYVIILPMMRSEEHAQMMWRAWIRLYWHIIWACPSQLERQISWA